MENTLLRIGILVLIAFILFNVLKQSNMLGKNVADLIPGVGGLLGDEESSNGENDQLEMIAERARTTGGPSYDLEAGVRPHEKDSSQLYDYNYQVLPYPQIATSPQDSYFYSGGVCESSDPGCYSGSTLQAPDLLPGDHGANSWEETSPESQGHITDQNFLESGHHYGINTVGQSLKNANQQLRSDPPIPKVNIGPFRQSTIDPDTNRKAFEIES
tara:strand:+ start:684 stop:1328 length:645 start_codon:yes stop_codon:yes gene_type:complete